MRLAKPWPLLALFTLVLVFLGHAADAFAAPAAAMRGFDRIEAVRGDPGSFTPPSEGWTEVTLPDPDWTVRWPGHDGVVWYRLQWSELGVAGAAAPIGLTLSYLSMAGAVYLNDALLAIDPSLNEPLSRSWNRPRHWLLSAPLLRPGRNVLLVRVSGLSAYTPGLGEATLGAPATALARYEDERFMRQTLHLVSWGINLAMGVVFGLLWLLRRKETFYGWFSLFALLWGISSYNYVAMSPWPFDSTYIYSALRASCQLISIGCFLMFTLRFCALRDRHIAFGAWAVIGLIVAMLWLGTRATTASVHRIEPWVELILFLLCVVLIFRQAWQTRAREIQALALCTLLALFIGVHDALVVAGAIDSNRYYSPWAVTAMLTGITFVLTRRFVVGMRLVEQFNAQLQLRVGEATQRLSALLQQEHAAALTTTRLAERMNLVRDLHDGLGLTLSSHIASLEREHGKADQEALWALREVRDDLRLIIENSALDPADHLLERLAPLRHRTTRVLQAVGIEATWKLRGLETCRLDDRRCLDFLRLLQEVLANVLKHSRATQVCIDIEATDANLSMSVRDNGCGFDPYSKTATQESPISLGLRSMEMRARRLSGVLAVDSNARGTTVTLAFPLA